MKQNYYQLENIQKTESPIEKLGDAFVEEAAELETQNYHKTKEAVLKLEKAIQMQKSTTEKLQMQSEKISKIKDSSITILKHAESTSEVSHKIRQESSMFPGFNTMLRGMKRWWKKDKKIGKEVEKMKAKTPMEVIAPTFVEKVFEPLSTETIPGENKTDNELVKLLNCVKSIGVETHKQLEIVKVHKEELSDINKLGKYSKKIVKETEMQIRKK
ncbi:hypothetical protein GINT2_001797 [Glugoides intestinalis]